MDRPLSECLIVVFFRPSVIRELPTQAMCEMWPDAELRDLAPTNGVPLSDSLALYALQPKSEADPVIRFGINSMSINAHGAAYPNWSTFKAKAVSILETAETIYKSGEMYQPLLLQYVDIFNKENAKYLSCLKSLPIGMPCDDLWLRFSKTYELAEMPTTANIEYTKVLASEESKEELFMVSFAIETSLPRLGTTTGLQISRWLDQAHILSKKLFWDALESPMRNDRTLFTEQEFLVFAASDEGDFPSAWEKIDE